MTTIRQTIADLARLLHAVGAHGDHLAAFDPHPEQLDEIAADLDQARRLLTRARAALTGPRCPRHPGGPVDPTAGGTCLLCATYRRRGQVQSEVQEQDVDAPLEVVARTVAEYGQREAMRRHGARTVARALVHHRLDPALTQESA
ncbi:hypothetical protein [Streptomyces sp. NRRL B-1347]|uniref:hypothetical protein n=1 Tax=Streptomyces sp. NRRL B-1347 TaxID=1476877 RepID=UPI00068A6BAC|nr:hypothetical protein [Streptomyces sp. NRRL B-1347]